MNASVTIVEVEIQRKDGYVFANSKDVPGLHLCSQDPQVVAQSIIPAIKMLFKLNRGLDVEVVPAADIDAFPTPAPVLQDHEPTTRFVMMAA
jgi:hypothetical protein